jgi:hypothetical protein
MSQDDWRNWSNHPLVVAVTFGAALLSIYTYFEHRQRDRGLPELTPVSAAGASATANKSGMLVPPRSLSSSPNKLGSALGSPVEGEVSRGSWTRLTGIYADPPKISASTSVVKVDDVEETKSERRSSIRITPERPLPDPVQESPQKGDGTQRIQVSGVGFAGAEFSGERKKYLARRAAEVDARRNLAEILATNIRSRTDMRNGEIETDEVSATVNQIVRGARIVGERELPDGGYEVTLRVDINLR